MRPPIPLTAALFLLTGCGCSTGLPPVPVPAALTAPCPPLAVLPPAADLGTLLEAAVETAQLYHECRVRHAALSGLVE